MEIAAEGRTSGRAIEGLRDALVERHAEPAAVAPPSRPAVIDISLTEAPHGSTPGPQGPGEAM